MKNSKFSLVLRQCRENSGLTQKQVADALNVERSTYAYYETGTTHPSGSMIIKLSNIFNVDYKIFMEAVGDVEFDNNDEDENFTTLSDTSWRDREKIYTLPQQEQNLLLYYRSLSKENRDDIMKYVYKMKMAQDSENKKS